MAMKKKERKAWMEAFIDGFCESKMTVYEIGKMTYASVASARNTYNRYIQDSGRSGKVKVMARGERIFLYKV